MKKIYKLMTDRCDCEGHYIHADEEFVATENIEAVIEAKKVEIETLPTWWMGFCVNYDDDRPRVTAKEIVVREA